MISYTKLKDGSWGLRASPEKLTAGSNVTVRKKDGSTKTETVARIIWQGDGVTLASIAAGAPRSSGDRGSSRGGRTRTGCSCGSVEEYSQDSDCWTCRHDSDAG